MSKKSKEVNERRLEHKGEVVSRRKKEKCIFTESSEILLDIFMPEYYIDYLKLNESGNNAKIIFPVFTKTCQWKDWLWKSSFLNNS